MVEAQHVELDPTSVQPKRPGRPVWVGAAAAVAVLCGGGVYVAGSGNQLENTAASEPTTASGESVSEPATTEALCGSTLPDQFTVFPNEDPANVRVTTTIDPSGRLVYEATVAEKSITVVWPAIERLTEPEPPSDWETSVSSVGGETLGTEVVFVGWNDFNVPPGPGQIVVDDESVSVVQGNELVGDECAAFTASSIIGGEATLTESYRAETHESGQFSLRRISVQPLVASSVETETPPALDKTPNSSCPASFEPLNEVTKDSWARRTVETPTETPQETFEEAVNSTGFLDYSGFTELRLSDTKIIYALNYGAVPRFNEPNNETYFLAYHVEKQADGWLATHFETASGC